MCPSLQLFVQLIITSTVVFTCAEYSLTDRALVFIVNVCCSKLDWANETGQINWNNWVRLLCQLRTIMNLILCWTILAIISLVDSKKIWCLTGFYCELCDALPTDWAIQQRSWERFPLFTVTFEHQKIELLVTEWLRHEQVIKEPSRSEQM